MWRLVMVCIMRLAESSGFAPSHLTSNTGSREHVLCSAASASVLYLHLAKWLGASGGYWSRWLVLGYLLYLAQYIFKIDLVPRLCLVWVLPRTISLGQARHHFIRRVETVFWLCTCCVHSKRKNNTLIHPLNWRWDDLFLRLRIAFPPQTIILYPPSAFTSNDTRNYVHKSFVRPPL